MFKRRLIISASLVLLVIIGSIIDAHTGFKTGYFAIGAATALAAYWIYEFLLDLICYSMDYDNEFKLYIAEKVNKTRLTYEDIKAKEKYYFKEFKRSRLKGRLYRFMKLALAMGVFIFLVVCLCK